MLKSELRQGFRDGLPICLGYFSVAFGVGILAVKSGLSFWIATIISATNLTSAGEVAGIGVIAAGGSLVEMALTQLLINCRYALMGLTLSQKTSPQFTGIHRFIAAYGITDEIFGVAASRGSLLTPAYMYSITLTAAVGWVGGTFLGAVCGEVLPAAVSAAMGIMLYGMFLAIIIPAAKDSKANLAVVVIAAAVSCMIYFFIPKITSGFAIIISAVIAAIILALVKPIDDEDPSDEEMAA